MYWVTSQKELMALVFLEQGGGLLDLGSSATALAKDSLWSLHDFGAEELFPQILESHEQGKK